jgi:hypothetical protein
MNYFRKELTKKIKHIRSQTESVNENVSDKHNFSAYHKENFYIKV